MLSDGKDVRQFMRDWVNHYRNLLMTKFIKDPQSIINMSVENIDRIRRQSDSIELTDINRGILELSKTMREARWSTQPRILLELAAVTLSSEMRNVTQTMVATAAKAGGTVRETVASQAPAAEDKKVAETAEAAEKNTGSTETADDGETKTENIGSGEPSATRAASADAADALRETGEECSSGGNEETFDLNALWKAVFEDGEAAKGSFYIIGSGAELTAVDEYEFTVTAESEHVKRHAENNRELLENLMEKHTGRRRAMKVMMTTDRETADGSRSIEDVAREAEDLLGVKVEIK